MNVWSFDNDELFELVRSGKKTATCSLYNPDYIPEIGESNIIENSRGEQISIEITYVSVKKFCDIDVVWAKKEGEGDLSLAYWIDAHSRFFTEQCNKNGFEFNDNILLLCEEFKIVNS